MTGTEKLAKALVSIAKKGQRSKSYSEQAQVVRVEGDTAWVHIPNGVDETPVKKTIACKTGDVVQVRVGKNGATLTGNMTAPPTDDTKAEHAQKTASSAAVSAKKAQNIAEENGKKFSTLNQYFWTKNGTGTEAGAHVTEVPQSEFEKSPSGGNILIKSVGMIIRDGLTELLQVLSTGITIGPESGYHLTLSANSITFQDGDLPPFTISFDAHDREAVFEGPRFMQSVVSRIIIRDNQESLQTSANNGNNQYNIAAVHTYGDTWGSSASINASTGNSNRLAEVYVGAWDDTQECYVDLRGDEVRFDGDPLFKTFLATGTVSISANSGANCSLTGTIPTGYTPVAVQKVETEHNYTVLIGKFALTSSGANVSLRNVTSSTDYNNMTVTATILCSRI